jgi:hypothetical protein
MARLKSNAWMMCWQRLLLALAFVASFADPQPQTSQDKLIIASQTDVDNFVVTYEICVNERGEVTKIEPLTIECKG